MITLINGPARGQILALRRAPLFLRAVLNRKGEWDGLDQLDDHPADDEEICVYQRIGVPTFTYLDYTGRGGRRAGGKFASARYRCFPHQPSEDVMRNKAAWRNWTTNAATAPVVPTAPQSDEPQYGLPDAGYAAGFRPDPPGQAGLFG